MTGNYYIGVSNNANKAYLALTGQSDNGFGGSSQPSVRRTRQQSTKVRNKATEYSTA
jgi:hypothetical protein